jgi:hypothetical protein
MTDAELGVLILLGIAWVAGGCAVIWLVSFAIGVL